MAVFEKMCATSQKNVKSHVFWIFKKKRKKVTMQLVMQPLITQLPEVGTGKSRSPTSSIMLRSAYTRNYATENCV